jgi:hypothetical protein
MQKIQKRNQLKQWIVYPLVESWKGTIQVLHALALTRHAAPWAVGMACRAMPCMSSGSVQDWLCSVESE